MSESSPLGFGKFVPGFDFLQNLAKGASSSIPQLPSLSHWVAPTINVEELEKRIEELKAVQFWLEQNSRALAATIQALEVQKMTLATLKGMNFSMGDVANAFKLKTADAVMEGMQKAADTFAGAHTRNASQPEAPTAAPKAEPAKPRTQAARKPKAPAAAPTPATDTPMVDPAQWWGALTHQFQQIATTALQDAARQTAVDATRHMSTGLAKEAIKTATDMATKGLQSMVTRKAPATKAKPAKPAAKKAAARKSTARKPAARKRTGD